jgi:hypothetical protein
LHLPITQGSRAGWASFYFAEGPEIGIQHSDPNSDPLRCFPFAEINLGIDPF